MSLRIGLIACSSFEREIQAVQVSPDLRDVHLLTHRTSCDLADSSWAGLGETAASCREEGCPVGLIGGYCLTRPVKTLGLEGAVRLHQESQCVEWVADRSILEPLFQNGGLLVLPGWLRDWEAHLEARWPSDRKAAQSFF